MHGIIINYYYFRIYYSILLLIFRTIMYMYSICNYEQLSTLNIGFVNF